MRTVREQVPVALGRGKDDGLLEEGFDGIEQGSQKIETCGNKLSWSILLARTNIHRAMKERTLDL